MALYVLSSSDSHVIDLHPSFDHETDLPQLRPMIASGFHQDRRRRGSVLYSSDEFQRC